MYLAVTEYTKYAKTNVFK